MIDVQGDSSPYLKALNYLNKTQERWPGNSTALATAGDSSPPGTFANICADKSEGERAPRYACSPEHDKYNQGNHGNQCDQ